MIESYHAIESMRFINPLWVDQWRLANHAASESSNADPVFTANYDSPDQYVVILIADITIS